MWLGEEIKKEQEVELKNNGEMAKFYRYLSL